jgi:Tfp pilus assembly protein PilX
MRHRRGHSGFTLGEIMVALVLVTVALLGLIGVRLYASRASAASPDKQTASLLAISKMAEVEEKLRRGMPFEDLSTDGEVDGVEGGTNFDPDVPERFSYQIKTEAPDIPNLVQVTVEVKWKDDGRGGIYRLRTRFTEF